MGDRRLTPAEMRARYEAGASTRQIAAVDGRSYARINYLIRRAGGTLRRRGRFNQPRSAS